MTTQRGYGLFVEQTAHITAVLEALNKLDMDPRIDKDEHHFIKVSLVTADSLELVVGEFQNELGPGAWEFYLLENK